jgi:hypothetical protein
MKWVPINQAADYFQCSSRTIRRKIKIGKLSSKLSNGMRMVWVAEHVHTVSSHTVSIPKDRYVMRLFELYEGLSTLRMRFEGPLEMADFLEYTSPPTSQGKASDFHTNCRFFFEHLDTCFRQVDRLLNTFDLDQTVLLTIYRTVVILQTHWQESGLYLQEEQMEEKVKGSSDTLAIFTHLVEQARMLLLLCAQQSPSETESHAMLVQGKVLGGEAQPQNLLPDDIVPQPSIIVTAFKGRKKDNPALNKKMANDNREKQG